MPAKKKRNNERTLLENGCSFSNLTVHPSNWLEPDADVKQDWYIHYRFYDPTIHPGEKYYGGKPCPIKGMNCFKTLSERRAITKTLLDDELDKLKNRGYNPITGQINESDEDDNEYVIHPNTPFATALTEAHKNFQGEKDTKADLKSSLKYIKMSISLLRYDYKPIKEVKRRHIVRVLENCANIKEIWNNNQFNHYRSAFLMLYRVLVKVDAVDSNIIHNIEIKKYATPPPRALTLHEYEAIDKRLLDNDYLYWVFINIFLRSGSRITEMARLKGKHVNLSKQIVHYLVLKGDGHSWVERPITDAALPFWIYAMRNCKPDQYVFSKGLLPGDRSISPDQFTRRWRCLIKNPIKDDNKYAPVKHEREKWMNIDMYKLKHFYTTVVIDYISKQAAADMNAHTTTAMVDTIYDLKKKLRKMEAFKELRKVDIKLA